MNFNEFQQITKELDSTFDSFSICGSTGLFLQGVSERTPHDIDIIVEFSNLKIEHQYDFDFCKINRHQSIYINDKKIDIMSCEQYWKIISYYDLRIRAQVQIYPQIHYVMQYVLDHKMTTSSNKRISDLNAYNEQILKYNFEK